MKPLVYPQPKLAGESKIMSCDFARYGNPTNPSATVVWLGGTADPDPSAMLGGAAQLDGTTVKQLVTGGVVDAQYAIRFACDIGVEHHIVPIQFAVV